MIEVKGITKYYGHFMALGDVSFNVAKGEVLGFLGPNGAGKSTTMKILTTYISASEGTATVAGKDVHVSPLEVRKHIGYLPETPPLYGDMTVEEYLKFAGRARGLAGDTLRSRLDAVVNDCGLRPKFKSRVNELSKGYKQRTGIAQALIHDPDVLILDEPTSGLDPRQIIEIRKLIDRLRTNKCIIFSTHILQEATAVASRLVIVNGGRKVADGTVEELGVQSADRQTVRLLVRGGDDSMTSALAGVAHVRRVDKQQGPAGYARFVLTVDGGQPGGRAACEAIARLVQEKGLGLAELAPERQSLEQIFLDLLEKSPGKTAAKAKAEGADKESKPESPKAPEVQDKSTGDDPHATRADTRVIGSSSEIDMPGSAGTAASETAIAMGEAPDPDKTLFVPKPPDREED
ncbi:MAG: ATP-binding cassette domain-containing protein [Planctomycetes bacterium]|nr:ATP-binding cassette domain-containing protein [Planctomycetota bacterium]MCW8134661.1 ATP-binding cassette domain-containing protein [Planctomycetota bacterium]